MSHCSLDGKLKHPRSLSKSRRILTLRASSRRSSSLSGVGGHGRLAGLTWQEQRRAVSAELWPRAGTEEWGLG